MIASRSAVETEEADERDRDAGGERIADASADGLPAGVADVHRGRERAAEHRADDRADAVGEQDLAQVVVVARRRRALDVVHRLGEIVDAERYRGDEQRRDLRQSLPHVRREDRKAQAEMLHATCRPPPPACSRNSRAARRPSRSTEPTITATSPPGMPPGSRTFAVHAISTIAKHTRPIHGTSHIWNAGRIEMNATEMPASVPSIAARGVIARIAGPTKAPIRTMTPMMKHHASPACHARTGILGLEVHRQHDQEHDDEHVRHAGAVRHRGDVAAAFLLAELPREIRVEEVAERQRDAERRQDAAEHRVRGQLHDAEAEPGQHDHIEQNVGEQTEEPVPVSRHPEPDFARTCRRVHDFLSLCD